MNSGDKNSKEGGWQFTNRPPRLNIAVNGIKL